MAMVQGSGWPGSWTHGDIGGDPLAGELDAAQQALAPRQAGGERGLTASFEHQQVPLQPQPPAPVPCAAPGDQVRRPVEAVAHEHRPSPREQQSAESKWGIRNEGFPSMYNQINKMLSINLRLYSYSEGRQRVGADPSCGCTSLAEDRRGKCNADSDR